MRRRCSIKAKLSLALIMVFVLVPQIDAVQIKRSNQHMQQSSTGTPKFLKGISKIRNTDHMCVMCQFFVQSIGAKIVKKRKQEQATDMPDSGLATDPQVRILSEPPPSQFGPVSSYPGLGGPGIYSQYSPSPGQSFLSPAFMGGALDGASSLLLPEELPSPGQGTQPGKNATGAYPVALELAGRLTASEGAGAQSDGPWRPFAEVSKMHKMQDMAFARPAYARYNVNPTAIRTAAEQRGIMEAALGAYGEFEQYCAVGMPETMAYGQWCMIILQNYQHVVMDLAWGERPDNICKIINMCNAKSYIQTTASSPWTTVNLVEQK